MRPGMGHWCFLPLMDLTPLLICWNICGLNNPAKRKAAKEFLDTVKTNLVCF